MSDTLYDLMEQRVKEAERERKEAKERFKLLAAEIAGLKRMLVTRSGLERRLPKGSSIQGGSVGRRKRENGGSAPPV